MSIRYEFFISIYITFISHLYHIYITFISHLYRTIVREVIVPAGHNHVSAAARAQPPQVA